MFKDILAGVQSYFWALGQIRKSNYWKLLIIAGLISLSLGVGILLLAYGLSDNLGGWVSSFYKWEFGKKYFSTFSNFISGSFIAIVGMLLYKYLILLVVSPFMSPVSERCEQSLISSSLPINPLNWIAGISRGLRISIRNLSKELVLVILLLLLSFIPGLAILTTPLIFIVQAYYAGFGSMDYTMERHLNIVEAHAFVRKNKVLAIVNGAIFLMILLIPVVGLFIAPTLATLAATKLTVERL